MRKWSCLQRCCSAMDTLGVGVWVWVWVWVWLSYAAAAISAAAVLYVLWGRTRRQNLPPGPPGVPLLGNLLQLGDKPNEALAALAAKYGPLMTLRLGMRTTMVVSSGSIAKQIFKTHDYVFAGRTVPHVAEALGHCKSSIGFVQQGPHLRMLRRISTTHLFTHKRIQSLQPLRQRNLLHMIRRVLTCGSSSSSSSSSSSGAGGGRVDVWQTVLQCTVDLMGNMVFGRDMSWEMEQFKEMTWELLLLHGLPNIADFFPFLRPLDPQRLHRRAAKAFAQFYNMLDPFIHEALRQRDNTSGLLSALLEARDEDDNLTLPKIRAFLTDMFVAGTGTLATTVEWAMAELMKNPEVMGKVQQELDAVVGRHRLVEEEDIEKLPYLKAVMKETFRLHPAAPLLPHRADEAVQVCGYDIPRHTAVVVNLWAIGRDKGAWQQPHCFWPERFQGSHIDFRGQHFELIPFGAGRRICVGLSLGDIFVHIILAHLLHCFEWSLPDGIGPAELDMSDKFSLSLQKAQPLLLHPSPRLPLDLYSSSS